MEIKNLSRKDEKLSTILAIANQKGGVGKTFLVFHLAHYLFSSGGRVLVLDLDPQGNLTLSFFLGGGGREELCCQMTSVFEEERLVVEEIRPGFYFSGADISLAKYEALSSGVGVYFRLKRSLKRFLEENQVDFVLMDCPPSLGLFSLSAFVAARKVIIPLRAEIFSVSGLGDLLNVIADVRRDINPGLEIAGIVVNAVNPRTRVSRETLAALEADQSLRILAQIPATVKVEEALRVGKPLWEYVPSHRMAGKLKEALKLIIKHIV